MPNLAVRGTWLGGGCQVFTSTQYGDYASFGNVSHTNYSLVNDGADGSCGGYKFYVQDNNTGQIIYRSTSPAQSVSLFFDGIEQGSSVSYDCINGACTNKNVHKTPGLYASLSECQLACGTGCGGKCLSNADWAKIESLSNQIMNKTCN